MTIEADVAVIKEVVVRVEEHVDTLNGTVAGLKESHLIQRGVLIAVSALFGLLTAGAAIGGTIAAIIQLGG